MSTEYLEQPPPSGETLPRVDAIGIRGTRQRVCTADIGGLSGWDA
jgi:hypothetical protein